MGARCQRSDEAARDAEPPSPPPPTRVLTRFKGGHAVRACVGGRRAQTYVDAHLLLSGYRYRIGTRRYVHELFERTPLHAAALLGSRRSPSPALVRGSGTQGRRIDVAHPPG